MKERLLGVADVAVGGQNLVRASLGTAQGWPWRTRRQSDGQRGQEEFSWLATFQKSECVCE